MPHRNLGLDHGLQTWSFSPAAPPCSAPAVWAPLAQTLLRLWMLFSLLFWQGSMHQKGWGSTALPPPPPFL